MNTSTAENPVQWLFLDLNAFFASCEQQENPALRGQPVIVVQTLTDSAVAIAASYAAKSFGIKTGTLVPDARQLCPDVLPVQANHRLYTEYHERILKAVDTCLPVEKVCSIDEMACKLMGTERQVPVARELAVKVKQALREQVGECLTCSIGIAPNVFLGKVGSDLQKPDGLVVITKADLPDILLRLELQDIYGIGPRMEQRLHRAGIANVEQLWNATPREDLYYGSDQSAPLQANSGTIVQGITSPKGNLIFGPWQNTEYYLSIGQGFHSNDLRGASTNVDALATEINFQQGNPTIVTQGKTPLLTKATGYEVGVRSEPVPNLKLEGALFVLNLDSEARFSGDEAVTTPGRPSQRKGIELTASYKPFSWLRLDGDFAATHARFANGDDGSADTEPGHPGNYIPGAANMIATASATVEDVGPWFGALRFRYFGRRPLIEDNSVTSKPTTLVDVRIGYKLSEQARLWLDILNLFNNTGAHQIDYFYPSQLASETTPVYDVHFKPVEPLSVRFTLSMTF